MTFYAFFGWSVLIAGTSACIWRAHRWFRRRIATVRRWHEREREIAGPTLHELRKQRRQGDRQWD